MKRLFLLILLVMMVYWIAAARRPGRHGPMATPRRGLWNEPRAPRDVDARGRFASGESSDARKAIAEARRAIDEARNEARRAIDEARNEARQALDQARHEVREAIHHGGDPGFPSPPRSLLEAAEDLPVPIVPGTRVTQAEPGRRSLRAHPLCKPHRFPQSRPWSLTRPQRSSLAV